MAGVWKAAPAALRDVRLIHASRFVLAQAIGKVHLRRSRPAVVGFSLDALWRLSPADFGFDAGGDLFDGLNCLADF